LDCSKGLLCVTSVIKIPAPRGGVLKFTATDSVAEEKTNAASCGVLSPKIKNKSAGGFCPIPDGFTAFAPFIAFAPFASFASFAAFAVKKNF
jgi:hypothetical protein